ncbi:MAG: immunoglobulin-like domain-containing protein, partial [Patescibacteria group bacterium]
STLFSVNSIGSTTLFRIPSSNLLTTDSNGAIVGIATTSVTCSGNTTCTSFTVIGASPITISSTGGGTGLSTSSPTANDQVLVYNSAGAGSAYSIATTSLSISGPFTIADPIGVLKNGAVTYTGLATTSQPASSNLLVSNGGAGVYGVATSSATLGLGLSGSLTTLGTSQSLTLATSSLYTGTTGQLPYFSGTNTLTATSSLFIDTNQNVGIGTTSPYAALSVVGQAVAAYFTATTTTASTFPYASTTALTVSGTASTTALIVSSAGGTPGCATFAADGTISNTGSACGGGGSFPFTPLTNYGVNTSATTTALWAQAGLFASSTSRFAQAEFTNYLSVSSTTASTTPWGLLSINASNITGPSFVIGSSTKTDLIVTNGGYIGIGTTSPWGLLSVNANGLLSGAPQFVVGSSTNTNFIVANSGNVGVGTSSPYAKFSISANNGETNQHLFVISSSTSATTTTFARIDNAGIFSYGEGIGAPSGIFTVDAQTGSTTIANLSIGNLSFDTNAGVVSLSDIPVDSTLSVGTIQSQSINLGGDPVLTVYGVANGSSGVGTTSVGIGTTTPFAKLALHANYGEINPYLFAIGSSSPSATTTLFMVTNTGKVGIGTTSPYAALSVVGQTVSAYFTATTTTASTFPYASTTALTVSGTASTTNLIVSSAGGTPGCATFAADGTISNTGSACGGGGAFPFDPLTNYAVNTSATTTALWAQAGLFASSSSAYPTLAVAQAGAGPAATFMGGNVGIGTSTPQWPLTVVAAATSQLNLGDGTNTYSWSFRSINGSFYLATSSPTTFATSSIPAVTIVSGGVSGLVGIGTSSPWGKFSVEMGPTNPAFVVSNFGSSTPSLFVGGVNNNGNVGIGTTSPYAKLSIGGTPGISAEQLLDVASSSGATIFHINSGGNSGFGTTTPWAQLSVNPTALLGSAPAFAIGSSTQTLFSITPSNGTGAIFNYGARATTTVAVNSSYAWTVATSSTAAPLIRINSSTGTTTIGSTYGGDVIIGDTGVSPNLVFANSATIKGDNGGKTLTIGAGSDLVNLAVNTGFGSSTPWKTLSVVGSIAFNIASSTAATTTSSANLCVNTNTWEVTRSGIFVGCIGSSERFKHDIKPLAVDAISIIKGLQPVSYVYNEDPTQTTTWGFIAEQANQVDSHLAFSQDGTITNIVDRSFLAAIVGAEQKIHNAIDVSNASSSTPAITIDSSGAVAIGTPPTSPFGAKLFVSGGVYAEEYLVDSGAVVPFTFGTTTFVAELPNEVLTATSSVDLYKLATYNLSAVTALAEVIKAQDIRLTALEERVNALESGAVAIGTTTPFSTSSLASAFNAVGAFIGKGFAQFGTLIADQFVAATNSEGTSSAGTVTILAGNTVAQVNNSYVLPTSKIFVTLTASTTGSWYLSDKKAGSFKLVLSAPQESDVTFDYFIVQSLGQVATSTPEAGSVSQSPGPDIVAPTITLLGDNPLRFEVGDTFTDPGVSVVDAGDANVAVITFINGIQEEVNSTTIDTGSPTTYIITYSATDTAGNNSTATRSVIVGNPDGAGALPPPPIGPSDITAPTVTLTGAAALELTVGDTFTDPGATATDDVDGDLTSAVVVTGTVDPSVAGTYTLTYTATDAAGNTGSVSRLVTVIAS